MEKQLTPAKQKLKKEYFKQKELLQDIRDEMTLRRWEILSKAYKLGKKINGPKFTREQLSKDMEMPLTTVLRCLSLDRANNRTWKLIDEKKISAFKVAQICMSKNVTYQDEIVDMVIEDDLTSYQISSLKIKGIKDVSKEKHRLACENGYSREHSAYKNIVTWIERGTVFMLMDKEHLPVKKLPELKRKLNNLTKNIEAYSKGLEE